MGGHKGGDVASKLAVDTIARSFYASEQMSVGDKLVSAISTANQHIFKQGKADAELNEMGTTVTAAVVKDNDMLVAHVGDSGLFLIRDNSIRKITVDHTLAEQMLRDGLLKQDEIRTNSYNHILTRALGVEPQVNIDIYNEKIRAGDRILLCTDGLSDLLDKEDILKIVRHHEEPEPAARQLIDEALRRGGYDNVTVVMICI
jgi:protein phosphatase